MSAQHTKGPWTLQDCGRDGWKVYAAGFGVIAAMPAFSAHPNPQAEQAANARLIAATPTMLDALVEAAGALQGAAECMRKVDAPKTAGKLEEIALAALLVIAKATGSSHG